MSAYKGRVALVTGASSGIGAAIAEALVKEGVIVVGAARRVELIQALSDTLKGQPGRLIAKKLDVSKAEEIVEIFKTIENELGGVDVLVNNAALLTCKAIHKSTPEEMKYQTDVNVSGVLIASREVINGWINRKIDDGYIININSIAGHVVPYLPGVFFGVYPVTKFAISGACEELRHELKNSGLKCRVTSVCPGVVKTEMTVGFQEANAMPHYLTAEEVAKTVTFALNMPKTAEITEITIRPTNEAY